MPRRANQPFGDELRSLLEERSLSLRGLARDVGVDPTFLSRAARSANGKRVSGELATRVEAALGLDPGHFIESREEFVIEQIRSDPRLRDRLYQQLRRGSA